jgi:hypothetical protein
MKSSVLFLLVLIFSTSFIYAVPQLPEIVTGNVYINNKPAKVGTEITALMNGEEINKIQITEKGKFELLLQKLEENQEVDFYVDGIYANQNISYKSGDFQQLTLKVEKSYLIYYIIGALALIIVGVLIWKYKKHKKHGKK